MACTRDTGIRRVVSNSSRTARMCGARWTAAATASRGMASGIMSFSLGKTPHPVLKPSPRGRGNSDVLFGERLFDVIDRDDMADGQSFPALERQNVEEDTAREERFDVVHTELLEAMVC